MYLKVLQISVVHEAVYSQHNMLVIEEREPGRIYDLIAVRICGLAVHTRARPHVSTSGRRQPTTTFQLTKQTVVVCKQG